MEWDKKKAIESLSGPEPEPSLKPEKWMGIDCEDTMLVEELNNCEAKGYTPFQVLPIREDVQAAMPRERFRILAYRR